jgi:hypothetical protein
VYTAEHFVVDILLGWALAVVVLVLNRAHAQAGDRKRPRKPDIEGTSLSSREETQPLYYDSCASVEKT